MPQIVGDYLRLISTQSFEDRDAALGKVISELAASLDLQQADDAVKSFLQSAKTQAMPFRNLIFNPF